MAFNNGTNNDDVFNPAIGAQADSGYVVTRMSACPDGSGWSIYAQRYDAGGRKTGKEVRVTTTAHDQLNPAISALADGSYVMTWESYGQDGNDWSVYAQRFDAGGRKMGNEVRLATTACGQWQPAMGTLTDGGYVVTWMSCSQGGSGWDVYAQRYDADGSQAGKEVRVNTTTASDQMLPAIGALADGGYVVTWESYSEACIGWGVYAQHFDAAGNKGGNEVQVNNNTAGNLSSPTIGASTDGGYVATWVSADQDGSADGICAQRYDASGGKVGNQVRVNTAAACCQSCPAIGALNDGGWVVSWLPLGQDDSSHGVYAQRYDASGNPIPRALQGEASDHLPGWTNSKAMVAAGEAGIEKLKDCTDRLVFLAANSGGIDR